MKTIGEDDLDRIHALESQLAAADDEIERLREQRRLTYLVWEAESVKTLELEAEIERLRALDVSRMEDVAMLLKAFDDGLFVRNISCDDNPLWAIKLLTPLAAMGRLQRTIETMKEARDGA